MNRAPSDVPPSRFYTIVVHAGALVFGVLAILLFTVPRSFLDGLGLDLTSSTDVLCRRAAVLLLGLAVLSFSARNAAAAATRRVVAWTTLVTTGAMAVLGSVELARGATTAAILRPVAIETVVAVVFLMVLLKERP